MSSLQKGMYRESKGVHECLACVHRCVCHVCAGEGVEQGGTKDMVHESLTSKVVLWLNKAGLMQLNQLERKV